MIEKASSELRWLSRRGRARTHDRRVNDPRMHEPERLQVVLQPMPDKDCLAVDKLRQRPLDARDVEDCLVQVFVLHATEPSIQVEDGDARRRSDVLVEEDRTGSREDRHPRERHAGCGVYELAVEGDEIDGGRQRSSRRLTRAQG